MPDPAATPVAIVDSLFALNAQLIKLGADFEQQKALLIAQGKGKYAGTDGRELTVVEPTEGKPGTLSVCYVLDSDEAEDMARKLAGDDFTSLFERRVIHLPCEGFEHVVPKLLTPAKARDLLQICRRESTQGASAPKKGYIIGLPKK